MLQDARGAMYSPPGTHAPGVYFTSKQEAQAKADELNAGMPGDNGMYPDEEAELDRRLAGVSHSEKTKLADEWRKLKGTPQTVKDTQMVNRWLAKRLGMKLRAVPPGHIMRGARIPNPGIVKRFLGGALGKARWVLTFDEFVDKVRAEMVRTKQLAADEPLTPIMLDTLRVMYDEVVEAYRVGGREAVDEALQGVRRNPGNDSLHNPIDLAAVIGVGVLAGATQAVVQPWVTRHVYGIGVSGEPAAANPSDLPGRHDLLTREQGVFDHYKRGAPPWRAPEIASVSVVNEYGVPTNLVVATNRTKNRWWLTRTLGKEATTREEMFKGSATLTGMWTTSSKRVADEWVAGIGDLKRRGRGAVGNPRPKLARATAAKWHNLGVAHGRRQSHPTDSPLPVGQAYFSVWIKSPESEAPDEYPEELLFKAFSEGYNAALRGMTSNPYPDWEQRHEPIALSRKTVDKLLSEGLVSDDGARIVEMMMRRRSMSESEVYDIVSEAAAVGGTPASGKAIAAVYSGRQATPESKEVADRLSDYRMEHMADDFKPGGKYYRERKGNPKGNPKPVASMPASEINRELDKLDAEDRRLGRAMIDAGRGNERPSEYLRMTDPLSVAQRVNYERRMELRHEMERRYGPGTPSRLPAGRGFGPLRNPARLSHGQKEEVWNAVPQYKQRGFYDWERAFNDWRYHQKLAQGFSAGTPVAELTKFDARMALCRVEWRKEFLGVSNPTTDPRFFVAEDDWPLGAKTWWSVYDSVTGEKMNLRPGPVGWRYGTERLAQKTADKLNREWAAGKIEVVAEGGHAT